MLGAIHHSKFKVHGGGGDEFADLIELHDIEHLRLCDSRMHTRAPARECFA